MGIINSQLRLSPVFTDYFPEFSSLPQGMEIRKDFSGKVDESGREAKRYPQFCSAVALDLDGTLLMPDGSIPSEAPKLLSALEQRGIPIILASARPPRSVLNIQEVLGLEGPVLALNGAWVGTKRATLQSISMEQKTVSALFDLIEHHHGLQWNLYAGDKWYVNNLSSPEIAHEVAMVGFEPDGATLPIAAQKLLVIGDATILDTLRHEIRAANLPVEFSLSNPRYLEIVSHGVSKLNGIQSILPSLGRSLNELLAVGDGENDISLIAGAGHGVAMKTKLPGLYAACDTMIGSNEQKSVISFLIGNYLSLLDNE